MSDKIVEIPFLDELHSGEYTMHPPVSEGTILVGLPAAKDDIDRAAIAVTVGDGSVVIRREDEEPFGLGIVRGVQASSVEDIQILRRPIGELALSRIRATDQWAVVSEGLEVRGGDTGDRGDWVALFTFHALTRQSKHTGPNTLGAAEPGRAN